MQSSREIALGEMEISQWRSQAWTGHCDEHRRPSAPDPLLVILPVITSNSKW